MEISFRQIRGILFLIILLYVTSFIGDFFNTMKVLSWPVAEAEAYEYYLPYALSNKDYWTGVALKNGSTIDNASVTVTGIKQNGSSFDSQIKSIPPLGQTAFMMKSGEGWVKVSSNQPLTGLAFVAESAGDALMFDITLIPGLAKTLYVPHVAQNETWDTIVYVCNPNGSVTTIYLTFVKSDGTVLTSKQYTLGANSSGTYPLSGVVGGGSYASGSIQITASQGVAAFALYQNLKTGSNSYAGISAVEPEAPQEPSAPSEEEAMMGNFKFVYYIGTTLFTDRITLNKKSAGQQTSEGTDCYEGYEASYPSSTLALGAWYPSISKYVVVCQFTSTFSQGYTFSINSDNSLTGFTKLKYSSTWSDSTYALIKSQSYKAPVGSWPRLPMKSEYNSLDIEERFEIKVTEDQLFYTKQTGSSSSTDDVTVSIINELLMILENHR